MLGLIDLPCKPFRKGLIKRREIRIPYNMTIILEDIFYEKSG
jgi:hypothetical protein